DVCSSDLGTEQPTFTPATIRGNSISEPTSTRALISADQEVLAAEEAELPLSQIRSSQDSPTSLMWLDPRQAKLLSADAHTPSEQDSHIVPVLLHTGITAKENSERQTCPACGTRDSVRYIGSAAATLLSVALAHLFRLPARDAAGKRPLT